MTWSFLSFQSACFLIALGADKADHLIALVQKLPGLRVWILTGREAGNLRRALLEPEDTPGTCIKSE